MDKLAELSRLYERSVLSVTDDPKVLRGVIEVERVKKMFFSEISDRTKDDIGKHIQKKANEYGLEVFFVIVEREKDDT